MSQATEQPQRDAVVLLSGGLDSATVLAIASADGYRCHALSIAYGQRHAAELAASERLARHMNCASFRQIALDMRQIGGSALTDDAIDVPVDTHSDSIPVTYVPARNTVFLSLAMGLAEVLNSRDIFIGVNAVDYSGYPDCRAAFIQAFESMSALATKSGVESGKGMQIHTPLIHLSKAQIIQRGMQLGVDYAQTVSCYQADAQGWACGACDSCRLRREGFLASGYADPTKYF